PTNRHQSNLTSAPFFLGKTTVVGTPRGLSRPNNHCPCSTPVGVTVVGTPCRASRPDPRSPVLNACRRHCGRHCDARRRRQRQPDVLNACRRHCGRHFSLTYTFSSQLKECS